MIEERWFSYPIWCDMVEYEHHEELLKYCLLRKAYDDGRVLSNHGGWQSLPLHSNIDEVMNKFCIFLDTYVKKINKIIKRELKIANLWININGYKTLNHLHTHPLSYISGVFYVKANENQGDICFENPLRYFNQFAYNGAEFVESFVNHKPQTGKLLLFPSSLPHSVLSNETNIDRISISFNTKVVNE
jgi:uncharacterized protein (TIGR02466 family)